MIIKGGAAGNVGWWGAHLTRDDTNDRAELIESKGLLSEDVPSALREMDAIASQSRSHGNFLYQANINPRDNEHLTPEQWAEAVDTLEKNLGLEGHQRIVVEHEKDGRTHRHVVWNRVDVETLRVTDIGGNYYTHERTARDLEQRFGLAKTQSLHGEHRPDGRPERAPELSDIRAESKTGISRAELKAELTELWRTTDSGKAFKGAVEERGYILAQGDRRDFVIVDHAGDAHSLARRIEGVKAADVRERMLDLDRATLPTVAESRAQQRAHYLTAEAALDAWRNRAGAGASREPHHAPRPAAQPSHESESARPTSNPTAARAQTETRAQGAAASGAGVGNAATGAAKGAGKGALMVLDAVSGGVEKLTDFVASLFDGGSASPPPPQSNGEQRRAQHHALQALGRISERMQEGAPIPQADVRSLTPAHLDGIRKGGDEYLRILVQRLDHERERERERERDGGRERERERER